MTEFKKYVHHGVDLEMAILGACLIEKSAMGRTYGLIEAECFYFSGHKIVYEVLKEMYDNSLPIDMFTVTEYIIVKKGIELFEGHNVGFYVTGLTNHVVSSAHLEYHCHLVKEMWRRRRILEIKYSTLEDDIDPRKNLFEIDKQLREVLGTDIKRDWFDMPELIYELMKHQADMVSGKKTFVTTGFKKADSLNGGFYNGHTEKFFVVAPLLT